MKDWLSGVAVLLGTALIGLVDYDLLSYVNIPHLAVALALSASLGSGILSTILLTVIAMLPAVIGKGLRLWGEYK